MIVAIRATSSSLAMAILLYTKTLQSLSINRAEFKYKVFEVYTKTIRGWFSDFFFARVINNKLYYLKDNKII